MMCFVINYNNKKPLVLLNASFMKKITVCVRQYSYAIIVSKMYIQMHKMIICSLLSQRMFAETHMSKILKKDSQKGLDVGLDI